MVAGDARYQARTDGRESLRGRQAEQYVRLPEATENPNFAMPHIMRALEACRFAPFLGLLDPQQQTSLPWILDGKV